MKYFKQIDITDADSLPKEEGVYFCTNKRGGKCSHDYIKALGVDDWWLHNVASYLIPVEVSEKVMYEKVGSMERNITHYATNDNTTGIIGLREVKVEVIKPVH